MSTTHVAFVPASGVSKEIRFIGLKLPGFFSWRIFHFLSSRPGIKVKYTGELNVETMARLEEALELYNNGNFSKIFVAGGYANGIKFTTSFMMKCYLTNVLHRIDTKGNIISGAIEKENVFVGGKSSDSIGHAKELVEFLIKLPANEIVLHIITSDYHL